MVRDCEQLKALVESEAYRFAHRHERRLRMKLTELEPRWFSVGGTTGIAGISFQCPHCVGLPAGDPKKSRLGVRIAHAAPHVISIPGDQSITHTPTNEQVWQITGDAPSFDGEIHGGFDTVSLTPSVDASKSGHWHGWITNGEIK